MAKEPEETRGRKPRGEEASSNVTVRMTAKERRQYEAAATKRSQTLAEWIRAACAAFLK